MNVPHINRIGRIILAGGLAGGLTYSAAAHAENWHLSQTFNSPTPASLDYFGGSVAIDGNSVLIGAFGNDNHGVNVGQAYLFNANTGALLQTFDDPTPTEQDNFGGSVAVDGNTILISALGDDTIGRGFGQVHLFDATTATPVRTFDNPAIAIHNPDVFGISVAIDGNNVLIGAPGDGIFKPNVGQTHLFDAATGAVVRTFDNPTGRVDANFGGSVAIDGDAVVVGTSFDQADDRFVGQAHLFSAATGALLQTFDDPTPTELDFFGGTVAIDGNKVLIGAQGDDTNGRSIGQAHLFDAATGALLRTFDDPTVTEGDRFGVSVAIDSDAVLIGALHDDTNGEDVGQAYLFDAATGILLQIFDDPTPTRRGVFGASVAIDGDKVLIGATVDSTEGLYFGQAYLFSAGPPMPQPIPAPPSIICLLSALLALGAATRRGKIPHCGTNC